MAQARFGNFVCFVCIVLRLVAVASFAAPAQSEPAEGMHHKNGRAQHFHLVHKKGTVAPTASTSPVHHHHHHTSPARPAARETRNRHRSRNSNSHSSGVVTRGVNNSHMRGSPVDISAAPTEMNRHKRSRSPMPAPMQRTSVVTSDPLVAKVVQGLHQASQFSDVAGIIESLPVAIIRPGITLFAPNDRSLAGAQFSGNSGLALLSFHIVTRRFEFSELSAVREGTKLSTILDGISVVVSHNSTTGSQIDNALIIEPDIYVDDDVAVHGVNSVFDAYAYNRLPSMQSRQAAIQDGNPPVADVFPPDIVSSPDQAKLQPGSIQVPTPLIENEPDPPARVTGPSAPNDLKGDISHENSRDISPVSSAVHLQKGFISSSLIAAAISILAASIFS